jgi:transcriptional regulator with XRE-family HTH domain
MGFAEERDLAERALAAADQDDGEEPEFPPVARRFAQAREALGLSQAQVAERWHQPTSMYWDLEFHDSEAFDVISVGDLGHLASVLQVSPSFLLFGGEPSPPILPVSYSEAVRRIRETMAAEGLSIDEMSDAVGVELRDYLQDPERLSELPIFELRWVCQAAGIDWVDVLAGAPGSPSTAPPDLL